MKKYITIDEYRKAEKTMLEYQKQIRHAGRLLVRYRNHERKRYKESMDEYFHNQYY